MKLFLLSILVSVLASCARGQTSGSAVVARANYQDVGFCNEDEFDRVFQEPTSGRRELLSCYTCRTVTCLGWVSWSQCRAIMCDWCRRRDLQELDECDVVRDDLEARHVAASIDVSASCQEKLQTRSLDCYKVLQEEQTGSNNIHSITLWNADADVIIEENMVNGTSVCENGFQFSLEAVTGAEVKQVKFELYGLQSYNYIHTELEAPFTMFAEEDRNIIGHMYQAGTYEIIVTPDDDSQRKVGLEFVIKASTHPDCIAEQCSAADFKGECNFNYQCRNKYPNIFDRTVHSCSWGACQCLDSEGVLGVCGCQ